jgi:hypothetical protein
MSLTNIDNNVKNIRSIVADSIYSADYFTLDGTPIGGNVLSTRSFLKGITKSQAELGYAQCLALGYGEAKTLQSFLNNTNLELTKLKLSNTECRLKIIVEVSSQGYLFLEDRVTIPENIDLEFFAPVLFANKAQLYLSGQAKYIPANAEIKPTFIQSYPIGTTTFRVNRNGVLESEMNTWTAGDVIRFRYEDEDAGNDVIIQSATKINSTIYEFTVSSPTQYNVTTDDGIRKYNGSIFNSTAIRGQSFINVVNTTNFNVGAYVSVFDIRPVSEITGGKNEATNALGSKAWYSNNRGRHETKVVVKIDNVNKLIYFSEPLVYDYDSVSNSMAVNINPIENTTISGLNIFYFEYYPYDNSTYKRLNKHKLFLQYCVNCHVKNLQYIENIDYISTSVQNPNIDVPLRLDKCYSCKITDCILRRTTSMFTSSSVGYGITLYSNSKLQVNNIIVQGFRHSFILSGTNTSTFNDIIIDGGFGNCFDMHGCGEWDNLITNVKISENSVLTTLSLNNSNPENSVTQAIKLGNETHSYGPSYNLFKNIEISGCRGSGTVLASYGIQVLGQAINNVFDGIYLENCDTGILMTDYARGRLNSNLYIKDTLFNNITMQNCDYILLADGAKSKTSSTNYVSSTSVAYNSNSITLNQSNISSLSYYTNYYSNWVLDIQGTKYTTSSYNGSNGVLTINTNFSPALTSNVPFTLYDSDIMSIYQIDGVTFSKCFFNNISKTITTRRPFECDYIKNLNIIGCTFNNCTNSNYSACIDLLLNSNVNIIDNVFNSNHASLRYNSNVNVEIYNNQFIDQSSATDSNINDLANNSNVYFAYNRYINVNGILISSNSRYNNIDVIYGFSNTPNNPSLKISQSNGCVGILKSTQAFAPLSFNDTTSSKKISLYENTSNNAHQFFGFGVDSGSILRYQASSSTAGGHVFYCATSSTASREMMRIGTGQLSINKSGQSNSLLYLNANSNVSVTGQTAGSIPFITFETGAIATNCNVDQGNVNTHWGRIKVNVISGSSNIPLYIQLYSG